MGYVARQRSWTSAPEAIQARSAQIVGVARKLMIVALPGLVAYVSWLIFRR